MFQIPIVIVNFSHDEKDGKHQEETDHVEYVHKPSLSNLFNRAPHFVTHVTDLWSSLETANVFDVLDVSSMFEQPDLRADHAD